MKKESFAAETASKPGVSVIVLTWNGIRLVKECLPEIVREVKTWDIDSEIILVDNGSRDNTIEYVKKKWPDIRLLGLKKNTGFSHANNVAARTAVYDKILFLNNDLVLDKKFVFPLLKHLEHESVFAVAPKLLRWDRKTVDDGLRYGEYSSGLFSVHLEHAEDKIAAPHMVTFFCGACFMCKKNIFLTLEGFDELFTPYAWEDLDLAYRAWKRGYKIIYEPKAVAFHKREATTRSLFNNFFFITLVWRNRFFFMWKNLTYPKYIINHLVHLPWKLLKFLCNGRWRYVIGFLQAVPFAPVIYIKRRSAKKKEKFNDKEVLEMSYQPLLK